MKKKDRQRMLEKYMKCAAWGSAGILLTCFIRGHVIKENGTVRELKISFLEKEKEVIADCAVGNIMTTLAYTSEKDHVGGPAEDVTQTVMKLFPIGTYLSAGKEDTIAEDSQTYAMILEKQANDEKRYAATISGWTSISKINKLIKKIQKSGKDTWRVKYLRAQRAVLEAKKKKESKKKKKK